MQSMLNVTYLYSVDHEYELEPVKSSCTDMILPSKVQPASFHLGGANLKKEDKFVHLGLTWRKGKSYPDIDEKISSARKAAYMLFGAGLHGKNGMDPATAIKIFSIFVTPTLLYGLCATVLPEKEIRKIEGFYRKTLRMLQGLPPSTAIEAVYLLSGQLPAEAILHCRALGLLGQISRLEKDHPLRQLAFRQLALRDIKIGSWFSSIVTIAAKYKINA